MESLSNSFIERIQVDEGFLDGLDLRLGRGLTGSPRFRSE